jgi:predicted ATPase
MNDLTNCELEPIRQDGEFALARVARPNGLPSCLLVSPVLEQPAPASIAKLENAFALRDELEASWAARPVELVRFRGRLALAMEDPDGDFLDRKSDGPPGVPDFLRLAISIASSLGGLHGKGLVHKDVKPANLIANARTGEAWLTGFSLATRLPRHRQSADTPEIIAGTLAYMAPEQTGRMNRSIDSRSDLYSLGVSFYEMLVGALPFTAGDPMEWVHCHVARLPVAPSLRRSEIPEPLSAIILKLLAKASEERYQTAAGLEADLRRCLAALEAHRRIESFSLGARDLSDRLLVPEKLYGREKEIEVLLAAFDRVVSQGTTELVLVSGYSGVGKSSVVNELHKALVPPRGLFASGKFDQYKRDIPYATLAQAFQRLIRPILAKSEAELGRWREALLDALGSHGGLIVDLVPELKLIVGEQEPVPELPAPDAQRRFQLLLRRFIGVFARPEHPLALFLDDLQWLDAATLDLLEDLLTQESVSHLLLIGAYRDNEVHASHPLMRRLGSIKATGASPVEEITLGALNTQHVSQLIADALHCETERVGDLAQLILQKTDGNPFFINQFLSTLTDEGLIAFDAVHVRWSWDLQRIHAKGYTDNVADLMIGKLVRLPAATQQALQLLACLGNIATTAMLALVLDTTERELHASLVEARRQELVDFLENSYRFVHDRVHEAAYALIPTERRAAVHLRIGRMLVADTPPAKLDEAVFDIVNQLNQGAALITSRDERVQLAELNLLAGQRAKQSAAYNSALTYLAAGRDLLPEDRWERRRALTFALEFHRAECEFLTGALAPAEERLSMLASRAGRLVDLAAVTNLREELFTTLGRSDRAIEACFDYLRRVGIEWSPHPMKEEVRREYERLQRQIGRRSIEELVDLPPMTDPEWRATMDVLTAVVSPALFTDENLLCLVICRMANLSLEHGNSDGSCFAYVWLGMLLGPHFSDYRAGFRFGKLGLDLVEQRGLRRFEARVYLIFGHRVIPWTQPIRTGRSLVRRAFDAANKLGDLTFAAYSRDNLITNLLASGEPLGEVQREAEAGLDFARQARFGLVIDRITTQLRLIRTLRGLTPEFASFNDTEFDEGRFEQHLTEEPHLAIAACWYWIRKLQARFFAGEHASAIAAAANAERLLWTSPSFFELAEYQLGNHVTLFDAVIVVH